MPFRSSIVGGIGTLIRQWIRSPDYVAGVSGWSINKDGTVEFNAGTFRGTLILDDTSLQLLVYDGTPAAGNLILAVSSADGNDSFGNSFYTGLTLYGTDEFNGGRITFGSQDIIEWFDPADSLFGIQNLMSGGTIQHTVQSGVTQPPGYQNSQILHGDLGARALGGLYQGFPVDTDATFTQLAVPTAAVTQITSKVDVASWSQYEFWNPGVMWVGATFTAPVEGSYDVTLFLVNPLAAANFTRAVIRLNGTNVAGNNGTNGGDCTANYDGLHMAAGDVLTFFVRHNAGVNTNMTGRISVHRRMN